MIRYFKSSDEMEQKVEKVVEKLRKCMDSPKYYIVYGVLENMDNQIQEYIPEFLDSTNVKTYIFVDRRTDIEKMRRKFAIMTEQLSFFDVEVFECYESLKQLAAAEYFLECENDSSKHIKTLDEEYKDIDYRPSILIFIHRPELILNS